MEPIESAYFNWLCAKVFFVENTTPSLTYWRLLRILHNTEFVWIVSRDDNRAEDGLELRFHFLNQTGYECDPEWRRNPGCSVLEMLIAFSQRAEFQTGTSAKDWFWEIITNLGLIEFTDANVSEDTTQIEEILQQFIWRTYNYDGSNGGLFPLDHPEQDQREVEIWYQFSNYLVDHDRLLS